MKNPNNNVVPQTWHLEVTARYLKQNMERAMRGDIERGLVELITNSDDSYRNLEEKGIRCSGKIEVEIERHKSPQPTIVVVRDYAEGMSREEMYKKLGALGRRTSGSELGKPRRGLHGRGAKDVAAFGRVKFESIKDGFYNCLVINNLECKFENSQPLKATHEIREKLGILNGNGTVVTIEVDPQRFRVPSHDKLKHQFSRYYSLRDIFSARNRDVKLIDKNNNRENPLYYKYPQGEIVFESWVTIDGYPNAKALIKIKKHDTPFENLQLPYREGILVKSAAAIHDCTYFGLESEPLAWRFSGEVKCDYIDKLVNEYDDREALNKENPQHPPTNNMRLLDPFRDGLIGEHPFTQALYKTCKQILKEQIEKLKLIEPKDSKEVVNDELRKKLTKLSHEISAAYEQKLRELEDIILKANTKNYKIGLHIIPPGEHPIEVGETKTFQIWVKHTDIIDDSIPIEVISSNPSSVAVKSKQVYLNKIQADPTLGKANFTVEGLKLNTESYIEVRYNNYSDVVLVRVTEKVPSDLPYGLSFERNNYRLKVNTEKILTIWFRKRDEKTQQPLNEVTVASDCPDIIIKKGGKCILKSTSQEGIYRGEIKVIGTRLKAHGNLTARGGEYVAKARVNVEEREPKSFQFIFEPVDEDFGILRYQWDPEDEAKLKIGARHPSVKRFLGEFKNNAYEKIDSPYYHIVLAEIIAEALTFKLLPRLFKNHSPDDAKVDAATADYLFHKYFHEFLLIAHKWLVD